MKHIVSFILVTCFLVSMESSVYCQRNPYDYGIPEAARNMMELWNQSSREKAQKEQMDQMRLEQLLRENARQDQMRLEREKLQLEREKMQIQREMDQQRYRQGTPLSAPTSNTHFLIEKANTLMSEGRYEEATSVFDFVIAENENLPDAWSGKAFACYKLNRYSEAIYAINRSLQLRPHDKSYREGREMILKKLMENEQK